MIAGQTIPVVLELLIIYYSKLSVDAYKVLCSWNGDEEFKKIKVSSILTTNEIMPETL